MTKSLVLRCVLCAVARSSNKIHYAHKKCSIRCVGGVDVSLVQLYGFRERVCGRFWRVVVFDVDAARRANVHFICGTVVKVAAMVSLAAAAAMRPCGL